MIYDPKVSVTLTPDEVKNLIEDVNKAVERYGLEIFDQHIMLSEANDYGKDEYDYSMVMFLFRPTGWKERGEKSSSMMLTEAFQKKDGDVA